MEIGIFAKTFPHKGALAVLEAVRKAGYSCTQFNLECVGLEPMPEKLAEQVSLEIHAAGQASGVRITALSGTYNMVHSDETIRQQGLDRLEVLMRHAPLMGTNVITLCTGSLDRENMWRFHEDNGGVKAWQTLLSEMSAALDLAESYQINLAIEPELANVVSSAEKAKKLIDTLASKHLKIILDPANLLEHGDTQLSRELNQQAIDLLGEHIVMVHAKDRDKNGNFTTAGQGVVDFKHLFRQLKDIGYSGPIITHGLSAQEAPQVAQFLKQNLAELA
ncbi:MAG: sugar phosphate isomerase/epimerase [Deinococcales bacterium]